jgi:hypothetical protein
MNKAITILASVLLLCSCSDVEEHFSDIATSVSRIQEAQEKEYCSSKYLSSYNHVASMCDERILENDSNDHNFFYERCLGHAVNFLRFFKEVDSCIAMNNFEESEKVFLRTVDAKSLIFEMYIKTDIAYVDLNMDDRDAEDATCSLNLHKLIERNLKSPELISLRDMTALETLPETIDCHIDQSLLGELEDEDLHEIRVNKEFLRDVFDIELIFTTHDEDNQNWEME